MIPSLLQIPSAVSDSKLHSVLPNHGKGDFTFDRSTGATRINKDGLIEEVGYFSSELVQNGNFSELGSEKATNGNFDNGSTNWTLIGDASIGNGVCTFFDTGSNTNSQLISQTGILANKTYKLVFDITRYVAGSIQIIFGGGSAVNVNITGGVGTYTVYVVNDSSTTWLIKRNGGYPNFDFDIDNISVKQVDPNDRWTLDTNWSYGSNKVIGSATTSEIQQDVDLPSGKVYKTTFTIEDYVSGDVRIRFRGGTTVNGTNRSRNGTYTQILTSTGHTNVKIDGGTSFTGSVTNISVVEVQGDRPRLSYDITNGVVEDKPHLLLEPSSTNLAKFSYNIQGGVDIGDYIKGSNSVLTYVSNIEAPDGTMGVYRIQNAAQSGTLLSFYSGNSKNVSLYVKAVDVNNNNQFTLFKSGGSPFASSVFTATNDWERYSFEYAQSSGNTGINNEGDTYASDVYIWGAQVEDANSYATSLIPTAGTTITRAAETCNNSKPSVNSTEGVLYAEIAALTDLGSYRLISLNSNDSSSNRITIAYDVVNNQIYAQCVAGGVSQALFTTQPTSISDFHKIAIQYKANDVSFYIDGELKGTDTSATMPTGLNTLSFDRADAAAFFYGKAKGLAVYNESLSESQLMQLTGVTASSIYNNFVTRTASFTVEALNEVKKVIDNL